MLQEFEDSQEPGAACLFSVGRRASITAQQQRHEAELTRHKRKLLQTPVHIARYFNDDDWRLFMRLHQGECSGVGRRSRIRSCFIFSCTTDSAHVFLAAADSTLPLHGSHLTNFLLRRAPALGIGRLGNEEERGVTRASVDNLLERTPARPLVALQWHTLHMRSA